jgi:FAD/FMN-containing dehydrogenase
MLDLARAHARPVPPAAPAAHRPLRPRTLTDVHCGLHRTRVAGVAVPGDLADLRAALARAAEERLAVSIGGGRHAMGGQQLGEGTLHLDTRVLSRVLALDRERGLLLAEAGCQWPALIEGYLAAQGGAERARWGIAQKQTGADALTLGGALAANAHGRGLAMAPFVADVESFLLVDAGGGLRRCSRDEEPELFALVAGGYGLFGVVYALTLRLRRRRVLERLVEVRTAEELPEAFAARIAEGCLYGDFQFETDERSPTFLRRGVFSCYRPVADGAVVRAAQRELALEDWVRLLHLAHADKARAFREYAEYYLTTHGQLYWSDTHQLAVYPAGYHRELERRRGMRRGGEMIGELYVPRESLPGFLAAAAALLRARRADVIYGTVRLIERDEDSFLAWAREGWACIVLNLCVEHSPAGAERAAEAFRGLDDLALERGGSFYLTYHRWARRDQLVAAYPRLPQFLAAKRRHDPEERFTSDWYRWLVETVG